MYIVRERADLPYILRHADEVTLDRLLPRRGVSSDTKIPKKPFVKVLEVGDSMSIDYDIVVDWLTKAQHL